MSRSFFKSKTEAPAIEPSSEPQRISLREQIARIDHNQAEMHRHIAKANMFTPAPWAVVAVAIITILWIQYSYLLFAAFPIVHQD